MKAIRLEYGQQLFLFNWIFHQIRQHAAIFEISLTFTQCDSAFVLCWFLLYMFQKKHKARLHTVALSEGLYSILIIMTTQFHFILFLLFIQLSAVIWLFKIYFVYNIDYICLIVLCTVVLLSSAFRQANGYCRCVYFHPKFTNKLSRWANKFCWTYPSVHSYIHVYVRLFEWLYAECFFAKLYLLLFISSSFVVVAVFFLLLTYNFLSSAFKENRANE